MTTETPTTTSGTASLSVTVRNQDGSSAGTVDLDPAIFGIEPNVAVMHQVVTAQLAAARAGTHNTRTRAEVRGGGAKPWRQKGTGRSRQGSIRSPQWRGGGIAGGPKPRDYRQRTPKKMVQLALRSALSDRARDAKVAVVDAWTFEKPRTKDAIAALSALDLAGKVLVVVSSDDLLASKSFRNLPDVHVLLAGELNAYDVLCADWIVFTRATLPSSPTPAATSASPAPPQATATTPENPSTSTSTSAVTPPATEEAE